MGMTLDDGTGVFISYQPNAVVGSLISRPDLDTTYPETAIVIQNDKPNGHHRCLIYRGDWRAELEQIYPDKEKLKEHWKQYGGHSFTDDLDDEEEE